MNDRNGNSIVAAKAASYRATSDGAITVAEAQGKHDAAQMEERADDGVANLLEEVAKDPSRAEEAAWWLEQASEHAPGRQEALRAAAILIVRFRFLVEADQ